MKKVIFLLGTFGAGKSSILRQAKVKSFDGYISYCHYGIDILGDISGADYLSRYKKQDVLRHISNNYKGKKLVIAGIYFSKLVDIKRMQDMNFTVYSVLLVVNRSVIYERVIQRSGSCNWNELSYTNCITGCISFFKKTIRTNKCILKNEKKSDLLSNYKKILSI